jgi:hypothetical protein
MGAFAAAVALVPTALLVEEFCARTRGREYANTAAPITAATATTLIRRKSFSVPVEALKLAQPFLPQGKPKPVLRPKFGLNSRMNFLNPDEALRFVRLDSHAGARVA